MGAVRNLWLKWKMLRLPWRKTFLVGKSAAELAQPQPRFIQNRQCFPVELVVANQTCTGQDLTGNTFWEFRDQLNPGQWRRMVRGGPGMKNRHYADVEISPQWHQWLRHTRPEAPSMEEQQSDIMRQVQLKHNARLADERWAAKARYIEKPKPNPQPMLAGDVRIDAGKQHLEGDDSPSAKKTPGMKDPIEDPFEKAKQLGINPSTAYEPEGWTPGATRKR